MSEFYEYIAAIILLILIGYWGLHLALQYLLPLAARMGLKIVETNPKWIVSKLHEQYYGFHDIDIYLAENTYGPLPQARTDKKTNRIEIILSNESVTANDIDAIAQLALATKLLIRHKLCFPGKSAQWLSILCYMLDGGDINVNNTAWAEQEDKKPVDCQS